MNLAFMKLIYEDVNIGDRRVVVSLVDRLLNMSFLLLMWKLSLKLTRFT